MIKDLSHGLKKITFVNHKRFSFGEVDVSGNTLLSGDNGAGKSTTIQAGLFFYGSTTNSELGIATSDGKSNWVSYAYPDVNSYVFYEYQGVHGRVLLLTYRAGNAGTRIGYRFVELEKPLDITALAFDEKNVAVEPDIIRQRLVEMGFKPSKQIDSASDYRRILHGDITAKKDRSYADFIPYTMLESKGDYQLLHSVQSSIFKNARVDSGTVENAIASSFGNDYSIDLKQIRGQITAVTSDYDEVGKYDARKADLHKLFDAQKEYRKEKERLLFGIAQLLVNRRRNEGSLTTTKEERDTLGLENDVFVADCDKRVLELKQKRDEAHAEKTTAEYSREELKKKAKKYDGFDMPSLSVMLDTVPTLELEKNKFKTAYEDFLGEKKGVDEIYSKRIEDAEATSREKKIGAREVLDKTNEQFDAQMDDIKQEYETKLADIDEKMRAELQKVLEQLDTIGKRERVLEIELAELRVKNPYEAKALELDSALKAAEKKIQEHDSEAKALSASMNTLNEKIKSYREKQELIQKSKDELLASRRAPLLSDIEELHGMLHADESTLLHFIREEMPDHEETLTALLKNDVLMSNDLNPQAKEHHETVFGLAVNTARLPASDLSKSAIKAKITDLENKIELLRTELDESKREELEAYATGIVDCEKKIYGIKEQFDTVEAMLTELALKKSGLLLELTKEEETAKVQWEKRKSAVITEASGCTNQINSLKKDKEAIEKRFDAKRDDNRRERDEHLSLVRKDKERAKNEFDSFCEAIDSALVSEIKTLESERVDALKKGGLDEQKVTELRKRFEAAKNRLEDAQANRDLVLRWRDEKAELDKLVELNKKVETTREAFRLADELQKSETDRMDGEKRLI